MMLFASPVQSVFWADVIGGVSCATFLMKALIELLAPALSPPEKAASASRSLDAIDFFCECDRFVAAFTWPSRATSWSWAPKIVTVNVTGGALFPAGAIA